MSLNPALWLIIAGILMPLVSARIRNVFLLGAPLLALYTLVTMPLGEYGHITLLDYQLTTLRLDGLSRIWAIIFSIAAFLGGLYSLHIRDRGQDASALIYAGAGIGAVLAGDLITLFVFWELTALSSVFLIWGNRDNPRALGAGQRYLTIHILSGIALLIGAIWRASDTGSIAFDHLALSHSGDWFILLAFGIKACFPLLHNWLQDAYPEATPTGTVMLSAFSTKLAVYALARGFAGVDRLIVVGAIMTAFPIFFAVLENDLRRVLAYSLNNQLGFMVVGIGIGSELALNGAAAHAFVHILYKALLFMSMGAVLHRVGTCKASELGGLWRHMPFTAVCCIIGAMSISAFPLLSGFVAKSLILSAAAGEHLTVIWLVLMFASAGVLDHSGIKVPFFTFFAHDQSHRYRAQLAKNDSPAGMRWAMGLTAAACIAIGVFPEALYQWLPFAVDYEPYTAEHIVTQMQLLMGAMLAFIVLWRLGLYPPEIRAINLDFDWVYRRLMPQLYRPVERAAESIAQRYHSAKSGSLKLALTVLAALHLSGATRSSRSTSAQMMQWVMGGFLLLLVWLIVL